MGTLTTVLRMQGRQSDVIIETADIYPTLCELAGLDVPAHTQGTSFRPALEDAEFKWDDVAFSQYPRSYADEEGMLRLMGTSMRTAEYRLTRWVDRESGELMATELYDHTGNRLEMENLAGSESHAEVLSRLTLRFEKEYNREHK